MGGDGGDLRLDRGALGRMTKGLDGALDELHEIGGVGSADVGRGFSELVLTGMETGSHELTAAFETFCDRWEWGVRSLIQDGNEFAARLGLSAGYFHEEDQYVQGTMKVTANSVMGNPELTEEQVEKRSWGQVAAENPFNQFRDADYSPGSFEKAAGESKEAWKSAAHDYMTSGVHGAEMEQMNKLAGVDQDGYDALMDEELGPDQDKGGTPGR